MNSTGRLWFRELRWILLFLVAATILGGATGYGLEGLALALALLFVFWCYQLSRIQRWLNAPEGDPPESFGLWGHIFDNIYLLQRRSRETQLRLESALDYLQDSLASMRDAGIIVDSRGNIAWANESANFLLGIKFPDDRGQPLLNLIRMPTFHQYFDAGDYGETLRVLPAADGDRCLQFEISRFGAGDRLVFVRDITETYRLEQMRRDFVGNVSHELRTPLTVIKGYIGTLLDLPAFGDPRFQRPLEQMGEQAERMERLLADLLWLSRIESVETQRKTELIHFSGLVRDTVNELVTVYPDRRLEFSELQAFSLLGDRPELHSAVSNLIINALKYGGGAPITVRLLVEGRDGVFEVIDQGEGIPEQHLSRLTERFYRVDKSRSQQTGGTGLGLAIVKHVAMSHQAELEIDSIVGQGSTFRLRFPDVQIDE